MQIKNLSKSFDDKLIFKDLSIELPTTGICTISGPSGCGKTTLMRIIAGLEAADTGEIIYAHKKLSFVFQEDRLLEGVTALGNIMAVLEKEEKDNALKWLELMGLAGSENLLPKEMSGGMKRRLAIARAFAYGGDLILLDEPFAGLDSETKQEVSKHIFNDLDNRLIILISHEDSFDIDIKIKNDR